MVKINKGNKIFRLGKLGRSDILLMVVSLSICLLAGFLGSVAINENTLAWYSFLNKSALNPPSWVFAPVWTILYIIMSFALYSILKQRSSKQFNIVIMLFGLQLVLNILWSHIFFANHSPKYGLVEILILDLVVILWFYFSRQISKRISLYILPYLLWCFFATYLNFYVVNNNLIL